VRGLDGFNRARVQNWLVFCSVKQKMSRIFISHSSLDNKSAEGVRDWLIENGWSDVFLDLDPVRGLAPGERWQNALKLAADRCEAVLFLISPNWLSSRWCLSEFLLAKQLGKRLFPIIIGDVAISSLPLEMSADHQVVDVVNDPLGWEKLKHGLKRAGLDADSFTFPAGRRIYPGFEPLTEEDAAIFFGRDAQILRGLDRLRLMRDAGAERMMVILGASGAGKSSFLRAGLWPRLRRDDRNFWPLPVVRPERAALSGRSGLMAAFEGSLTDPRISSHPALTSFPRSRAAIGDIISQEGPSRLLAAIRLAAAPLSEGASSPTLVLCIDQAEELLNDEGSVEARRFLDLLAAAVEKETSLLVILAIRSDAYPAFQAEPALAKIAREPFDLPPMPEGSLRSVVEGPARFAVPPLKLEASFVDALLADAKGQDALPLMAFTLNRLVREYGADHSVSLQNYTASGGLRGALTAAVDEALGRARGIVSRDEKELETLLHQAFVPHLARVNEAGEFARRVALETEIPGPCGPLVDVLVEARLLIRDQGARGEIIEVAHEALLREWPLLRRFLEADRDFLVGKRQLGDDLAIWREAPSERRADALLSGLRLTRAQQWLLERAPHDLNEDEREFIRESAKAAQSRQRWRARLIIATILLLTAFSLLAGWQWTKARQEATIAEQNASEAKREKDRADQSAADVLAQKNIAEEQKLVATQQAQRSDARAELIQSQFILKDAPLEALRKAAKAARQLDSLGGSEEALSLLWPVVNSARELPAFRSYSHFALSDATVFVRQPPPKLSADQTSVQPSAKPRTIVGGLEVTGVIDDDGKHAGPPFGSGEIEDSYTNDAIWLDDGSFVVAQGTWTWVNEGVALRNAGLRRRTVDGKQTKDYLPEYKTPVTSVAMVEQDNKKTLVAGDGLGNFIVFGPDDKPNIIPTGIDRPITRIISLSQRVVLIFGKPMADAPKSAPSVLDVEGQRKQISSAVGSSIAVSYFGDKDSDEIGCAMGVDTFDLYLCERNTVSVRSFTSDDSQGTVKHRFTAHTEAVSAIVRSPASPIVATGSSNGELRLWLENGALLAELPTVNGSAITALGFIDGGRRLLVSQGGMRQWDVSDLVDAVSSWPHEPGSWEINLARRKAWVEFSDQALAESPKVASLLESNRPDFSYSYQPYGSFLISAQPRGVRLINTQTADLRDVDLVEPASEAEKSSFDNTIAADRLGRTTVAIIGVFDSNVGPTQKPDKRHIYAIDNASGKVAADWELPSELKGKRLSMATSRTGERMIWWISAGRDVFLLTPDDKRIQHLQLPDAVPDEIKLMVPRDNSRDFLVVTALQNSPIAASTASLQQLPAGIDLDGASSNESPLRSVLLASTTVGLSIRNASISADGSRIALALSSGVVSMDISEVRVFDRNLHGLLKLPGCPEHFDSFQLGPDGTELRASSSNYRYRWDLRLGPMIDEAAQRSEQWSSAAERARAYKIGTEDGDLEKAKAALVEGVAKHPMDPELILVLANKRFYSAKDQKDLSEAMQLYDKSNAIDPYDPIAHYMRGRARAFVGNNNGAISDFTDAIALPHTMPLVRVIAGFLHLNQGIAKLSYQLNLQARAELFTRRALAREKIGDWQRLEDEDIHWLRANNQHIYALDYEIEAMAFDGLGKAPEAIADFEQAAKALSDDKYYGRLEEFKEVSKDPAWRASTLSVYRKRIGDLHRKMDRLDEAIADYSESLKLKADPIAFDSRAGAYQLEKKWDLAIQDYTDAIKLAPKNAAYHNDRGQALVAAKKVDAAITDFQQAINLQPGFSGAYHNLANAYFNGNHFDLAEPNYELAISNAPRRFWDNYNPLGLSKYYLGKYEAAIENYNIALDLVPPQDSAPILNNRAAAYREMGNPRAAMADLDKAIELAPNFGRAYYNRANVFRWLGDNESAERDYRKALELEPSGQTALAANCWLDVSTGALDKAIKECAEASALRVDTDAYVLESLGEAYLKLDSLDSAKSSFEKSVKIAPKFPDALLGRGSVRLKKGDIGGKEDVELATNIKQQLSHRGAVDP
jgi:tetratricopeptide (TPR) repeat protein/WD40 repeat protein